jgi:hypothetical protein
MIRICGQEREGSKDIPGVDSLLNLRIFSVEVLVERKLILIIS